jgi:hypothetical protein
LGECLSSVLGQVPPLLLTSRRGHGHTVAAGRKFDFRCFLLVARAKVFPTQLLPGRARTVRRWLASA